MRIGNWDTQNCAIRLMRFQGRGKVALNIDRLRFGLAILNLFSQTELSSTELESGNAIGAFLQTPAPVLDKTSGPMGARFLSSTGLGSGNLIGRSQVPPAPALDKKSVSHIFRNSIAIPLSFVLLATEILAIPGLGFVEVCDSRFATLCR